MVAESTRRSNMSRLRGWLGRGPEGEHLPDAYSGRIRLAASVSSDWERFQSLLAGGVNRAGETSLAEALALVRGTPLGSFEFQWSWAEQLRSDMVSMIIDAAATLADRCTAREEHELADWARTHPSFFQPIDDDTAACFRPLSKWASSAPAGYKSAALSEFSSDAADFLLVAHALAHGHVVVTHEVPSPNSSKRVKIPDACKALGVEWESPFAMLRKSKAKFDLVESFAPGHSSDSGRPGKDEPDQAGESNGGQGLLF